MVGAFKYLIDVSSDIRVLFLFKRPLKTAPAPNEHEKNGIDQTSSSTNKTVEPSTTRADTTRKGK